MKEEQVLQLMAEVGPNAKNALESWVNLQWAEFWASTLAGSLGFAAGAAVLFIAFT